MHLIQYLIFQIININKQNNDDKSYLEKILLLLLNHF